MREGGRHRRAQEALLTIHDVSPPVREVNPVAHEDAEHGACREQG